MFSFHDSPPLFFFLLFIQDLSLLGNNKNEYSYLFEFLFSLKKEKLSRINNIQLLVFI